MERLNDSRKLEQIAQRDRSPSVRAAATRRIHEQNLLRRIAQADPDWSVRLAAVQRINDQRVVEERVRTDPSPFVREGAARMVASEDVLRSLVRRESQPSAQAVPVLEPWVITGRLLHEDGSPLSSRKILLVAVEAQTSLPNCRDCPDAPSAVTSANGSFRFELRKDKLGPRQALTLADTQRRGTRGAAAKRKSSQAVDSNGPKPNPSRPTHRQTPKTRLTCAFLGHKATRADLRPR